MIIEEIKNIINVDTDTLTNIIDRSSHKEIDFLSKDEFLILDQYPDMSSSTVLSNTSS